MKATCAFTILRFTNREGHLYSASLSDPPAAMTLAAFTEVIDRQHHALYSFLRHLVGEPEQAYDLLQDTLYDAWRAVRQGTPPFVEGSDEDQQRRWLFRVAYHKAGGILRRRRLIRWVSLEALLSLGNEPEATGHDFAQQIAESEALCAALIRLAPQDRACFLLCEAHELSAAEVGQIIGASPEVVRKRLSRAKQRLRRLYLAQNPNEEPHS
jgi:RNA polymerase sigma-70 factor (ECF subfamily)